MVDDVMVSKTGLGVERGSTAEAFTSLITSVSITRVVALEDSLTHQLER